MFRKQLYWSKKVWSINTFWIDQKVWAIKICWLIINNFIDRKFVSTKRLIDRRLDRSKFVDRSNICDRSYWSIKNSNLTFKVRVLEHVSPHHSEAVLQVFHNLVVFFLLIILYFICFIIVIIFFNNLDDVLCRCVARWDFLILSHDLLFLRMQIEPNVKIRIKKFPNPIKIQN